MKVNISLKNVDEVIGEIRKMKEEKKKRILKQILDSSLKIQLTAKQLAPVRTGNLRRSILLEMDYEKMEAEIGAIAPYAVYVEFGTSRMRPRPYLIPAYESEIDNFENKIKGILEE